MKGINFKLFALIFFLFFLSLGSVYGMDNNITTNNSNIDNIDYEDFSLEDDISVSDEDEVIHYSQEYVEDAGNLNSNSLHSYKTESYFRAENLNMYFHDGSKFEVHLEDCFSYNPLSNQKIIFSLNNVNYTRITDNQGYASLDINLNSGTYSIWVYFDGNDEYDSCYNQFTITVKPTVYGDDIVKYYHSGTQYYSVFLNYQGKALINQSVNFNINGIIYTKFTNSTGWATLAINLQPGNYTITASNLYTGEAHSNKITVLSTIISKNLVKYFSNETQLEVQFLDDNGRGLIDTQVSFNINGILYTRTTNKMGVAKLYINLPPGKYIVTSINPFNDEHKGSNITVLSLLQSENLTMNYKNGKYRVKLVDKRGNFAVNASVRININGIFYTKSTNDFGVAYLNINLNKGKYIVTAEYNNCKICNTIIVLDNGAIPIMDKFHINHDEGFYSSSNLTVDIYSDIFTGIYYSLDNNTWFSDLHNVTFDFKSGIHDLYYYFDYNSNIKFHKHYVVGNGTPFVWASYGSGIYESSLHVNLTAWDEKDTTPKIYYTLDGSIPTVNSNLYNGPIFISNSHSHIFLRFFCMDRYNYKSNIVNIHYFFGNLIANINNGNYYTSLQSAIDDVRTKGGDILEISKDLNEDIILNKSLYLRSCNFKSINWHGVNYCLLIKNNAMNSIIDSFNFYSANGDYGAVILQNTTNCLISNNKFNVVGYTSIYSCDGLFNSIINNTFSHDYNNSFIYSISLNRGDNYYILNNRISGFGIGIYANVNNSIFNSNIIINSNIAMRINGTNNTISHNNLTDNMVGIDISGSFGELISNIITQNIYGVQLTGVVKNWNMHFNSIASNSIYNINVKGKHSNINATYNWWGFNNYLNIMDNTFNACNFTIAPYSCLYSYVSDYKSKDSFIVGATICANLNYAGNTEDSNNGILNVYDVSKFGCIPDGILINLNNQYYSSTHNGRAYFDVNLTMNSTRDFVVYLDNAFNNVNIINNSFAHIQIYSTALNNDSNDIFMYSFDLMLNEPIKWISVIWKNRGNFESEINLMIDGIINKTFIVDNSFYRSVKNKYSSYVFDAVNLYNKFRFNDVYYNLANFYIWNALCYDKHNLEDVCQISKNNFYFSSEELNYILMLNNKTRSDILLELIKNSYNLTNNEIDFIKKNADKFQDNIYIYAKYLGGESREFYIDTGIQNERFEWNGDETIRRGCINYIDGSYAHLLGNDSEEYFDSFTNIHLDNDTILWRYKYEYGYYVNAGYDGFMTFTFANTRVDDSILRYWLNQKNNTYNNGSLVYSNGFMKATYGSFIEGLLVIYFNDLVADNAALRYNVTWQRTSPMVMSVCDDIKQTVLSGESSFNFGRSVKGNADNVKAFNFVCSATFSPIENYVVKALFPNIGDNGSATVGLGFILESGGSLELIQEGIYTLIRMNNSNNKILLYDSETGIVRDQIHVAYGSYCYSNQQAEWGTDLGNEILDNKNTVSDYLNNNIATLNGLSDPLVNLLKSSALFSNIGDLLVGELYDSVFNKIYSLDITNPLNFIGDVVGYILSGFVNIDINKIIERYVVDPKFWAGIGGGLLFEAGEIAAITGIGLPAGLGLMGAGTALTAYSCGLFDRDDKGNFVGLTNENKANFIFSMACNICSSVLGYPISTFKSMGGEVLQQSCKKTITSSSYGGYYRTVLRNDNKLVSFKNPSKIMTARKYIIDQIFDETKTKKLIKVAKLYSYSVIEDYSWRSIWNSLYSNN